jgi:hypothetical protein
VVVLPRAPAQPSFMISECSSLWLGCLIILFLNKKYTLLCARHWEYGSELDGHSLCPHGACDLAMVIFFCAFSDILWPAQSLAEILAPQSVMSTQLGLEEGQRWPVGGLVGRQALWFLTGTSSQSRAGAMAVPGAHPQDCDKPGGVRRYPLGSV